MRREVNAPWPLTRTGTWPQYLSRFMRLVRLMLVAALCGAVSSCGSGGGDSGSGADSTMPTVPSVTQFPKVRGRTMNQLAARVQAGPVLAPAVSLLLPGTNRFGFGLFDRQRKQITDAPGALYISRGADAVAHGPYVARYETLAVKRRYLSHTVQSDPDAAQTLYVADLPFKKPGKYVVLGTFRLDNRLVGAGPTVNGTKTRRVPAGGDKAPKITTPTVASVGGDISKIDTRQPHDSMHNVNYPDAYGKRPIALEFATPALCQSRVCGPVVDIAE